MTKTKRPATLRNQPEAHELTTAELAAATGGKFWHPSDFVQPPKKMESGSEG